MNPQPLLDLLRPQRITEIVDIGANPIDGSSLQANVNGGRDMQSYWF